MSAAICEERLQLAEQSDEQEGGSSTKAPIAKAEAIRKAIQHIKSSQEQQHENRKREEVGKRHAKDLLTFKP